MDAHQKVAPSSTLANVNDARDWRICAGFVQVLIAIKQPFPLFSNQLHLFSL
jgi:hypothetical protein